AGRAVAKALDVAAPLMGAGVHPVVWGAVLLLVAIEVVLRLGDAGLILPLRQASYLLAVGTVPPAAALPEPAALAALLGGLVGQALLHAGWVHLSCNAVGLPCLGHVVQARAGRLVCLAVSLLTAVAGAVAVLLIADSAIMGGASGAVFGLLGVVLRG